MRHVSTQNNEVFFLSLKMESDGAGSLLGSHIQAPATFGLVCHKRRLTVDAPTQMELGANQHGSIDGAGNRLLERPAVMSTSAGIKRRRIYVSSDSPIRTSTGRCLVLASDCLQ